MSGRRLFPTLRATASLVFALVCGLVLPSAMGAQAQWAKTYGGAGNDEAYSIQETSDGGFIVAGYTDSFGPGDRDFWVLKLDANGNIPGCNLMGPSNATVGWPYSDMSTNSVTGSETDGGQSSPGVSRSDTTADTQLQCASYNL